MRLLVRTVLALVASILVFGGTARAAEPVDLLLVLSSDVSRSVDTRKFQLQREGYAAALSEPARDRRDPLRTARQDRDLLRRMVGRDLAQAGDRLDGGERRGLGAQDRRPDDRAAALVRGPHLDQRGAGVLDGAARALALSGHPPNDRCRGRRHEQFRARHQFGARRGSRQGRDHQRAGDPERNAAAVESRTHQPARRVGRILPPQRDRRARLVRDGGGEPQFVRAGDREEDDRRDRLGAAEAWRWVRFQPHRPERASRAGTSSGPADCRRRLAPACTD